MKISRLVLAAFVICVLAVSTPAGDTGAAIPKEDYPVIRVAIVGVSHGHVNGFLKALKKSQANGERAVEVVAIVESDAELLKRWAAREGVGKPDNTVREEKGADSKAKAEHKFLYTNLEEMLVEVRPDAVLVYTSTADHRGVIEAAARHGVSSMVEKPLTTTLQDALAIRAIAREKRVHVLVNYETTWYASNQEAIAEAAQGRFGEIRKVVVHDGHEGPKEIGVEPEFLNWLTDPQKNGAGALFDFGCYGADLLTVLMQGHAPASVTAVLQTDKPDIYPRVDDDATVILRYDISGLGKAQGVLMPSWNWSFSRKDMEVYGVKGYAITVGADRVRERLHPEENEKVADAAAVDWDHHDALRYLRAVLQGRVNDSGDLSSLDTNVVVMQILDAALRSARSGKTVTLGALPK